MANCNRRDAVTLGDEVGSSAAGPKPGRISFTPKLGAALLRYYCGVDPNVVQTSRDVAVAAVTAWASKDLLAKLLGPTAEYLGAEVAAFTQKCNVNISQIFTRALRKLGSNIDEPGRVNPRVLKAVLDEGAFTDNEVSAEYLAGILAGSRTRDGVDDHAIPLVSIIRQLSSTQLRCHYIFYTIVRRLYLGSQHFVTKRSQTGQLLIFVPVDIWFEAMGLDAATAHVDTPTHCVNGLYAARLIGDVYAYGGPDTISTRLADAPTVGFLIEPSALGAELYLWAMGASDTLTLGFLNREVVLPELSGVSIRDGSLQARMDGDVAILRRA